MNCLHLFFTPPVLTVASSVATVSPNQAPTARFCPFLAAIPSPSTHLRSLANVSPWKNPRHRRRGRRDFTAAADDDGDMDSGAGDDYDMEEDDEVEELDNKKDYDVEYDRLLGLAPLPSSAAAAAASPDDINMVQSESFVSTQGWDSETVVDYRINEDEFHKISLLHCDFFIRKPPDPDNDVYDFREMYVTPPDTDVYSIPKVLAPMPQKYIRCSKTDYGCYNVTEPPVDAPRDPLYKSEREVMKTLVKGGPVHEAPAIAGSGEGSMYVALPPHAERRFPGFEPVTSRRQWSNLTVTPRLTLILVFLTKHYRNRRTNDSEFFLDFEEIYVIDSKTKSITRAKVLVTVPGGRNRDRTNDMLIIRDGGSSFKIIDKSERDDPTTVIEREEWVKTRQEMERHLSKLRDFNVSNWF